MAEYLCLPPGAFGLRPIDNLRTYISFSHLPALDIHPSAPPIPPRGHKAHATPLSTRYDRSRRLQTIIQYNLIKAFNMQNFMDITLPDETTESPEQDPETGRTCTLRSTGFSTPELELPAPDSLESLLPWFECLPFQTIQRIVDLALPVQGLNIKLENGDEDASLFRYYTWGQDCDNQAVPGIRKVSVVIAVQPPWVLAQRDLDGFVKCTSFGSPETSTGNMRTRERLWAKMYDICKAHNCRYFVVSNWYGWGFGVFISGWSQAFTTQVYDHDLQDPTILECLLYWLASSLDLRGSFVMPNIPEPIADPADPAQDHLETATIVPSESSWAGKSSVPSSAGVSDWSGVASQDGLPPPWAPIYRRPNVIQEERKRMDVYDWMRSGLPTEGALVVSSGNSEAEVNTMLGSTWSKESAEPDKTRQAYSGSASTWLDPGWKRKAKAH